MALILDFYRPRIEDITVRNCSATHSAGGGILVTGSYLAPSLVNVVVEGCKAGNGGGVAIDRATASLLNVVMENNTAAAGRGRPC